MFPLAVSPGRTARSCCCRETPRGHLRITSRRRPSSGGAGSQMFLVLMAKGLFYVSQVLRAEEPFRQGEEALLLLGKMRLQLPIAEGQELIDWFQGVGPSLSREVKALSRRAGIASPRRWACFRASRATQVPASLRPRRVVFDGDGHCTPSGVHLGHKNNMLSVCFSFERDFSSVIIINGLEFEEVSPGRVLHSYRRNLPRGGYVY